MASPKYTPAHHEDSDRHSLRSLDLEEAKAMLHDSPSHSALVDSHSRPSRLRRWLTPCSIILNILLFVVVLVILSNPCGFSRQECVYKKRSDNGMKLLAEEHGFVPEFPMEKVVFMNDSNYANEEMFEKKDEHQRILDNWEKDVPVGRGFVIIPDDQAAKLQRPFRMRSNPKAAGFSIASFHQYHCLWMIMRGYGNAVFHNMEHNPDHIRHVTHCFDYLRQSVLCAGDAALEGKSELVPSMTDGWGNTHVCRNIKAHKQWIHDNRLSDFTGIH